MSITSEVNFQALYDAGQPIRVDVNCPPEVFTSRGLAVFASMHKALEQHAREAGFELHTVEFAQVLKRGCCELRAQMTPIPKQESRSQKTKET